MTTYTYNRFKSTTIFGAFNNKDMTDGTANANAIFDRDVTVSGNLNVSGTTSFNSSFPTSTLPTTTTITANSIINKGMMDTLYTNTASLSSYVTNASLTSILLSYLKSTGTASSSATSTTFSGQIFANGTYNEIGNIASSQTIIGHDLGTVEIYGNQTRIGGTPNSINYFGTDTCRNDINGITNNIGIIPSSQNTMS